MLARAADGARMPITADIPAAEVAIVEMTNAFRRKHELAAVRPNAQLEAAARAYARVLAAGTDLSHTLEESTPATRAQKAGYAYCQIAENLAMASYSGRFTPSDYANRAMRGWEHSPTHRRVLMLPHLTDIGVAVLRASPDDQRYIAVQLFGRPRTARYEFKVRNTGRKTVAYEFAGKRYDLEREQYMTHKVCLPGSIDVITGRARKATARYEARDGQVYSLEAGPEGVTVDVAPDPRHTTEVAAPN
ncbi:MAG: CAP domain-containing protein [Hyphomicrobium sp.]|nr:CAP domain-containing protein [Hyphomicrobium sp.]MCZ7593552.1 CAP domain-containing protein [Hyphomicrobium sp.]